ncbi:unnamed protein product [Nezara viridula]|uniref:Uncharacterized protein n=1 Tax=Nezara viridula TaxID=85310 RepID=A0A9P0HCV1_NEZVI|nr:unnamed protein product [Nezara viridula]
MYFEFCRAYCLCLSSTIKWTNRALTQNNEDRLKMPFAEIFCIFQCLISGVNRTPSRSQDTEIKGNKTRVTINRLKPAALLGSKSTMNNHQESDKLQHQREPPITSMSTEQLQEKRSNNHNFRFRSPNNNLESSGFFSGGLV